MNAALLLAHYERIAEAPDAIARLRRFVLDLAVRGKITDYSPVPTEIVKLGDLATFIMGQAPPGNATNTTREGKVFVKVGEFGPLFPDEVVWTTQPLKFAQVGDVLICVVGATIGKLNLAIDCAIGRSVAAIRPREQLDQRFLYYSLMPFTLRLREGARGTAQGVISRPDLAEIKLWCPPLAEQQRIVAKVDELMALCDQLEAARAERETGRDKLTLSTLARLNEPDPETFADDAGFALEHLEPLTKRTDQIKQLRQTILNLAVRGKLVEQDPNDEPVANAIAKHGRPCIAVGQFNVPEKWQWVEVRTVAQSRLGKMLDKGKNKGTPKPYLRNINVRWFEFDLHDLLEMPFEDRELEEFSLVSGDVLICEGGEPGRGAVWRKNGEEIYFQKALHRVRFTEIVDPDYFVHALRASANDGRLQGYFTGTGIKHFTGRSLDTYEFPLPPLAEQHRILAKVDELMALCDQLEASLVEGEQTRSKLLEAVLHEALEPA